MKNVQARISKHEVPSAKLQRNIKHQARRTTALLQVVSYGLILSSTPMARAQTAPTIIMQPASQTAVVGNNMLLSVSISGTGPFTYQWRFNGTNVWYDVISTVAGGGEGGAAT